MYQGIGKAISPSYQQHAPISSRVEETSEEEHFQKEPTLLHEIPDEIVTMIK